MRISFLIKDRDACDRKFSKLKTSLSKIQKPPSNINIYVVLPDIKILHRQQLKFDKHSDLDCAKKEIGWYKFISKQLGAKII